MNPILRYFYTAMALVFTCAVIAHVLATVTQ